LILPPPNCVYLSLYIFLSLSISFSYSLPISLFCSMQTFIYTQINVFHKIKYDLNGHMRPLLYRVIFFNSLIFWSNYNFDLRSYGQLLSLFYIKVKYIDR
jgi:hypothetical protein